MTAAPPPSIPHAVPSAARELRRAHQALEQFSSAHIRQLGLTASQFSVLLALSSGPTSSCKALCSQTSIAKGTLTGVIDRLIEKDLVRRGGPGRDRRSSSVCLTDEGRATFERIAREHFASLRQAFAAFQAEELESLEASLRRFRQLFNKPLSP